jgi:hypothetical protein
MLWTRRVRPVEIPTNSFHPRRDRFRSGHSLRTGYRLWGGKSTAASRCPLIDVMQSTEDRPGAEAGAETRLAGGLGTCQLVRSLM